MADNTRLAREVGAKIKYLRQKRGLSQEALALSCDMNPAFLGHVERGMRSPTLNTLQRICDGLGITLTELLWMQLLLAPAVPLPSNILPTVCGS